MHHRHGSPVAPELALRAFAVSPAALGQPRTTSPISAWMEKQSRHSLHYVAVLDARDEMIAFRCFGPEARVLGGAYFEDALDMGGGLRPDLTGPRPWPSNSCTGVYGVGGVSGALRVHEKAFHQDGVAAFLRPVDFTGCAVAGALATATATRSFSAVSHLRR